MKTVSQLRKDIAQLRAQNEYDFESAHRKKTHAKKPGTHYGWNNYFTSFHDNLDQIEDTFYRQKKINPKEAFSRLADSIFNLSFKMMDEKKLGDDNFQLLTHDEDVSRLYTVTQKLVLLHNIPTYGYVHIDRFAHMCNFSPVLSRIIVDHPDNFNITDMCRVNMEVDSFFANIYENVERIEDNTGKESTYISKSGRHIFRIPDFDDSDGIDFMCIEKNKDGMMIIMLDDWKGSREEIVSGQQQERHNIKHKWEYEEGDPELLEVDVYHAETLAYTDWASQKLQNLSNI